MAEGSIIVQCNNCGTKNRVPRDRLNDQPICGRCYKPISKVKVYDRPLDITDRTFNEEVIQCPGPVLVDCWAPWCGPCRMVAPVLDQLAEQYASRVKIVKLNVDESPLTAAKYSIRSIPTMLFFMNGKLLNTVVGAMPKTAIEEHLISILSS